MSPRTFVSRTAAFIALVALGAACETKTVVQPPPPSPIGVTVSPQNATLSTANQTVQFVALVTGGDATTARTVTWSSSNTAVATVDANGVAKAVANGTATIIAKSTADPTAQGAGLVTVNIQGPPPTNVVPPTASIASITDLAGNSVPLNNIKRTIVVTANVDQGTGNTISSINFNVDAKTITPCTQTLTQGKAAGSVTTQAASALVFQCDIPTDSLNAGVPVFANGPHTITVSVLGPTGQLASASQSVTFNNGSALNVSIAPFAAANSKLDASGFLWNGGPGGNIVVTVTPAVFSTETLASASVQVSGTVGGVATTVTKAITFSGNKPVTVTFFADSAPAVNGLLGFENANTTVSTLAGVTTAGQPFSGANTSAALRYDRAAPVITTQPTFLINTVGTTNWLSVANTFKTGCSGTFPNFTCNLGTAVTDNGVDIVTAIFQTTAAPGTSSSAVFTNVSALSSLSNTAANALVARQNICDALGNCAVTGLSAAFGVDLTPPIVQAVTNISGVQAAPQTIAVAAVDSLSGFNLATGFVQVQITKDSANSSGADVKTCFDVAANAMIALPSSGVCPFKTVPGPAPVTGQSFTIPVGTNGYFTVVVQAADVAGNVSTTTSRFFLMDAVAPTVTNVGVTFTTGAPTAGVNGTIQDNVDLQQYAAYETFGAAIIGTVQAIPFAAPTVVKAFGIPVNGKVVATATTPVILGIQPTWGGAPVNLNGFGFGGLDQANNFALGTVALTTTASAGVTTTDVVVANNTFAVDNATPCSDPTSAACATPTKTTVTPTAVVVMNNTTTANPLVYANFYRVVTYGATQVAQFLGQVATPLPSIPAQNPNQNLRVFTYTGPTLAATSLPSGVNTVFAIGVDKNGNAVQLGSTTFTVQP